MKLFCFLFFIFSMVQSYSAEDSSRITCLTSKCHSSISETQFLHSPIKAKGCIVCHQMISDSEKNKKLSADHPSVSLDMGKNQAALCLKCHVEWGRKFQAKKYIHSAIAQKGCTACHNPHGSDNSKLLKNKEFTQELCLGCHKKNENWEKGDKDNIHRAINAMIFIQVIFPNY
jgi:predicted CXXCH cytochrome family protein